MPWLKTILNCFALEQGAFKTKHLKVSTGPPRQPRIPRIGPCQVLAATLTLPQPGGADYAQPILGSLAGPEYGHYRVSKQSLLN